MHYDFKTAPDRRQTGAEKWNWMEELYGTDLPRGQIPFSIADMELNTPPPVVEGLKKILDREPMGYCAPTDSYRNAVCGWMERRHNWKIDPQWIVPHAGVVSALFSCVRAFTLPGDGVIIMTPVYFPFYSAVQKSRRSLVENPLIRRSDRYDIDFKDLEAKAALPENKMLILCSPHNPVGRVWTAEELRRIGDICLKYEVLVVSDEIHFDLILPGFSHEVLTTLSPEYARRFIVCTAPSKTFNLAGLHCSNLIIQDAQLRSRYRDHVEGTGMASVNMLGLRACELAYTRCEDWLEQFLQLLDHNRRFTEECIREQLPEIRVYPLEGTYLQWWDCRGLRLEPEALMQFMQREAKLFLDEGIWFGAEGAGFERINLACPTKQLGEAMDRLVCAVRKSRALHS